ncbi:uncharacterized protein C2orf78-like [Perognathus longimembris pacificus]|uniref:uncharacterized protein C2orf78-like n=1 Tax=Perognathus longimembris pacificus TaxID=214514 RepID=UPI0020187672|nr:uncharacterized protein C2orf78-like [Perognathus longimembris pacificus]
MHSLASATHTSSSDISSSIVSPIDVTSSLTTSDTFYNPSLLGAANALQLSLPVVSDATSLTGSVRNFSRISAPAVTSTWLVPSTSGTSFQPLTGSTYLYQHSNTMLSGVTGQSYMSTSASSCPSVFEQDTTGNNEKKSSELGDFTMTLIDQGSAVSSMTMTSQYAKTADANAIVPLYPSLSTNLVQGTPSQIPNQGHSLSLPYQEGNQAYYYDQNTLGPLLSGELGPCLQTYGSVSYTENRTSAPQPEIVMVLKEVQPTNVLPSASTSGIYYSVSAQPVTEANYQVMEISLGMDTSLRLHPQSQTFCLSEIPEKPKSFCSITDEIIESNMLPELGDISAIPPVQSSPNILALPPAPCQEQTENKQLDETQTKLSKTLDTFQISTESQDAPLLPLEISDISELQAYVDSLGQEEKPTCENDNLEKNSLSLEDQGTLEKETECSNGLADIATLVEDIYFPPILDSFTDVDEPEVSTTIQDKDMGIIDVTQMQEKSSITNSATDQIHKDTHEAFETVSGTHHPNPECLLKEEVLVCTVPANDKASMNTAKPSTRKTPKAASSRVSKTKHHGQEKAKRVRENNAKKCEETKQSGNKIKTEEKTSTPKMKNNRSHPELNQETFKRPRSNLGMHMLESVQVFHALGKKNDKKTGLSSSRALKNASSTQDTKFTPARKSWLHIPHEGKSPKNIPVKKRDRSESQYPSPSQDELPPPGKVKLVPLPFPTPEKPQARPVSHRPQLLASRKPTVPYPTGPHSNTAQPTAVSLSQPATANTNSIGSTKTSQPIATNTNTQGLANTPQSSVPQSAIARPKPYKTSSVTFLQHKPVSTAGNKLQSMPKPQNQYLLQDFSRQPIPWKKAYIPGPVVSNPITKEQRAEREAMKRQAQQERENAAKYTALGKLQFFVQREKDMEISRYYGYAM